MGFQHQAMHRGAWGMLLEDYVSVELRLLQIRKYLSRVLHRI